jgi:T-lymphoma invasion and metastasis-inducing protein 1
LIKPIQRILKYPLLLQQLKNLTDPYVEEHHHLIEALKGMEKVAEHINEMQRIHEEYGAIFDHLFRQHQKSCKQPLDLSPGKLPLITFHVFFLQFSFNVFSLKILLPA